MVAQVIVTIADEDVEHHAPKELLKVLTNMLARAFVHDELRKVDVAGALFTISSSEQRHGRRVHATALSAIRRHSSVEAT